MATTCFRTASEQIQRLLDQGVVVVTVPDGKPIRKADPVILTDKQRRVEINLTLANGENRTLREGRRLPKTDGWVVDHSTPIAKYRDEEEGIEFLIVAQPKAYLPDRVLTVRDIPTKGKHEITLRISGDFNGGVTVAGCHVRGWSCKNHPPEGYRLYSSWGTIPGCIPLQMVFKIVPAETA